MKLPAAAAPRSADWGAGLRQDRRPSMRRRRGIFTLFLGASASMGVIALYQMGVLRRVPEPRWPGLDSSKITGSPEAYAHFSIPDAVLALGSYALTMTLAAAGPPERADSQPLLPLALAAKVGFDAVVAAGYTFKEWRNHRAWCSWCLLASAAAIAAVPLAIPEARRAARTGARMGARTNPRKRDAL